MQILTPLLVGFLVSALGFLAPSMLSMTAVRTTIEKGKKAGIQFSAGAASVIFIQGFIAVFFAKHLLENPDIISNFKKAAIFVLLALAVFFFIEARKEFTAKGKNKAGNNYFIGFGMSALNQIAIPFYLAMATLAESKGWIALTNFQPLFYVLGAVIGAFALFSIYVYFAELVAKKSQFIAKNINYILSSFFVVLSTITTIQIFA